jgi:hypothetical protein
MSDFTNVTLDFSAEEERSSTIPEGEYLTEISVCEKTLSQAGNEYLKLEVKVVGDKYQGWIARENLNLWYTNADAEKQNMVREIASKKFTSLLKALGRSNAPTNATELQGCRVTSKFGIEKSNNPDYPNDKNNIVAFKPLGNAAPQQPGEAPAWVNEDKPSATPAKPSL